MDDKRPKATTTAEEEGLELHPDAWERFERTFDKVVTAPPAHRTGKPTGEDHPRKRGPRDRAKSSR